MDSSRFLIIGANGQLGKALQGRFPKAKAVDRNKLDITNLDSLQAFDWSNIDVILNAAVYANVDGAETSEGRIAAWQVNAQAVSYLSKIASQHDLTLVHISSDYVFDGTKTPHTEDEPFAPLGVYAQTKAAGDIAAAMTTKHYILRVSWLIGDGPNFVRTMIGLAAKNISPTVVADQIGRLTFTETLVSGIDKLLQAKAPYGTYNLSGDGQPASWAEITRAIFANLGRDDLSVTDTTTAEYFKSKPTAAPRPLQSTLDLTKIKKELNLALPDWRASLKNYIEDEQAQKI
ncbi:MAG TPA: NAD(P)-dependent oxidoreductase [Patescibacteria group bacterium]|jgi:dTDP-4-dehydrorhamnose reductase|nr:NAD(P)-dependent oxidoreductase [Patescibacteria group bacterium]